MAAAELTLAELQQLVQATIAQSKAVSDAGVHNAKGLEELRTAVDSYAASSAKAFDALAQTTTASLNRIEATLGRLLISNNGLDAAVAEMKQSLGGVLKRVAVLEQAPPPTAPPHQNTGPSRPSGRPDTQQSQGADLRATRPHRLTLGHDEHISSQTPAYEDLSDEHDELEYSPNCRSNSAHGRFNTRIPRSDFPKFDGDNPRWWKRQCEKYFRMYSVQSNLWVDFATMHFVGNAAL